ncbi:high mobility group B protein 13-like [Wolffia australiana]
MADVAAIPALEAQKKKPRGRRAALKDLSTNEMSSEESKSAGISDLLSPKKSKAGNKPKSSNAGASIADDLEELQAKLNQLRIEKEKADEMIKERDELLKQKDEEREKLHKEIKKLQKTRDFNPSVSIPLFQSLVSKDLEKKDVKKKKPSPAYVLWCKDQWNEIKKEKPEAEFKEISNLLGARWKSLSVEEKKPYEERYQSEKEAYLQILGQEKREQEAMKLLEEEKMQKTAMELLEQYIQFKQESEKEIKKTKKEKDPSKPKKPMSAFFLFCNERRAALGQDKKSVLEIAKITGEEWKNMDSKSKLRYEEMARQEKELYTKHMEEYTQKKAEETLHLKKEEEEHQKVMKQEALQLLKKKEKTGHIIKKAKETRKKKQNVTDPNKPKRPPSSFLLFSKETRALLQVERPGIDISTLNALISVKWKDLSAIEKQVWNDKAAQAMDIYRKELKEYADKAAAEDKNQASSNK